MHLVCTLLNKTQTVSREFPTVSKKAASCSFTDVAPLVSVAISVATPVGGLSLPANLFSCALMWLGSVTAVIVDPSLARFIRSGKTDPVQFKGFF